MLARFARASIACTLLAAFGGCATLERGLNRELRYPGGLAGSVYDRYYFFEAAPSKDLQLLRATFTVALLSQVATTQIRDGKEAEAFIAYLEQTRDQLNILAGRIFEAGGEGTRCENSLASPCFPALFESDLPALEHAIVNLAYASLPQSEVARVVNEAKGGSVWGTFTALTNLAVRALAGMHRGAATHRSLVEVFAMAAAEDGSAEIRNITDALCYLGYENPAEIVCRPKSELPDNQFETRPHTLHNGSTWMQRYHERLREMTIKPEALNNAFEIVRQACRSLPLDVSIADSEGRDDTITARRDACDAMKLAVLEAPEMKTEQETQEVVNPADPAAGLTTS